jgi:hypothetical protein
MKIANIIVFSLVLGVLFTMASMIRYEYEIGGDFEVFRYGFPLLWLFHDLQSFGGPVDIWSFKWASLILDFIFWLIISITIVFAWIKYKEKRN